MPEEADGEKNVRQPLCWSLVLAMLLGLAPAVCWAQSNHLTRKHHPWGQCSPGAWKVVRVVTEDLDETGGVCHKSTTETKTTLIEINEEGVTLQVAPILELAGRTFGSPPQRIKQGFHGEAANDNLKLSERGTAELTIEDHKYPCRIAQTELIGPNGTTTTSIYYSDSVAPYVLRRESTTTNAEDNSSQGETKVQVVAFDMPCEVLSVLKSAAQVETVQKHAGGTTSTLTFVSPDVPGGVICNYSKESDKQGRLVRRSMLKLVSYGFESEDERASHLGRKHAARYHKVPYQQTLKDEP